MLSAKADSTPAIPSVQEYFPEIKGDLTNVTWAHAVNSRNYLVRALRNPRVMILEADVVLGTLFNHSEIKPIMSHPPHNTSDLSLEMFLSKVMRAQSLTRKGVKLDFKSTEAFEASFEILNRYYPKFTFPVFLNADILPGPVDSKTKPVDAAVFVLLSFTLFPKATLSLGWTTSYGPNNLGNYSYAQLDEMLEVLKKYKVVQPVTLCVRAGLAAATDGIPNLVDAIDKFQQHTNTTVTIWMSSNSDPVDILKLRQLILELERHRVFLDVPKFIKNNLYLSKNTDQRVTSKSPITVAQGAVVAFLTSVSTVFSNLF